jgi:hypothetical protein
MRQSTSGNQAGFSGHRALDIKTRNPMKNFQRVEFNDFWPLVGSRGFFEPGDLVRYSDLVGFHVYADLRLNLDVAAAEDSRNAMKCVDLLEDFTAIADRCAGLAGARVLEAQGERIHFALPSADPFTNLVSLLVFSSALTRTVYSEIKPSAGEDWRGFSMSADHGPVVLVPSTYGGGSLVSLGNAANQPAKKLGRGVDAGHLALPKRIGSSLPGAKPSGDWVLIDVNNPIPATAGYFDDRLTEGMRQTARDVLQQRGRAAGRAFSANLYDGISLAKTPVRTRGMCQRADLDGFTKGVEHAFKTGTVGDFVRNFTDIMQYPIEFAQKIGRPIIELPWAGDCATMLIQPAFHETVEEMRASLPVEAGRCWHGIAYENGGANRWGRSLGNAKWAVGLACGCEDEGGNGHAIIAEFPAAGRAFRVLVGWCARRAKDAQETSGAGGDDVVIPVVDYQNLEEVFQLLFELTGSYRISNYAKLKDARRSVTQPLATSKPQGLAGSGAVLPSPRPFWPGN